MELEQISFDFDSGNLDNSATWAPRDIWARLNQRVLEHFREDPAQIVPDTFFPDSSIDYWRQVF